MSDSRLERVHGRVVLKCLAGSHAYGLAHAESDEDWRGVFVAPTHRILGIPLFRPAETIDDTAHETVYHECGKFVSLAGQANPSILDQLYMEEYTVYEREGRWLVDIRDAFLSQRVRRTYGGYAIQQMRKLELRERQGLVGFGPKTKKRYEKHARHCFRLIEQGTQILRDGTLDVRVRDREAIFAVGRLKLPDLKKAFEEAKQEMDEVKSDLPEEPDHKRINDVLLRIREVNWER